MNNQLSFLNRATTEIEVYVDESKNREYNGHKFTYVAMLFVPTKWKKEILTDLNNMRCNYNGNKSCKDCCENKEICMLFKNCEIHGCEINHYYERIVAEKWLNYITKSEKIYFNIIGIDETNLDLNRFGGDRRNIYSRFFRTCLKAGNYFFKSAKTKVKNIFHDHELDIESHKYFKTSSINIEYRDDEFEFECDEIKFIDSNTSKEEFYKDETCFIQLIDIILYAVTNVIHYSSTRKASIALTKIVEPLVIRMLENKPNINSQYHYFNQKNLSFFTDLIQRKQLYDKNCTFNMTRNIVPKYKIKDEAQITMFELLGDLK